MGFFDQLEYETTDEFDRLFDQTQLRRRSVDVPSGYYSGFIEDFRLFEGSNKKTYLAISVIITAGDFFGSRLTRWFEINFNEPERTCSRIKTDLAMLRYDWNGIRSLGDERRWLAMIGRPVDFKVTHHTRKSDGKIFTNIWFNHCETKPYPADFMAQFKPMKPPEDPEPDPTT